MKIRNATISDAAAIAKVQVDSWRTTYHSIVPDEFLRNLSYEQREERWAQIITQTNVFVAETNQGEIVGFASGGKERSGDYPDYDGELSAIYLFKDNQGQGIGKQLVTAIVEELRNQGFTSMLVFVLKENQAVRFYEALGAEYIEEVETEIGGKKLRELVYGWANLENYKHSTRESKIRK